MFFEIYKEENNQQFISIKLNKADIDYLLKELSLTEFDNKIKIRIELEDSYGKERSPKRFKK